MKIEKDIRVPIVYFCPLFRWMKELRVPPRTDPFPIFAKHTNNHL